MKIVNVSVVAFGKLQSVNLSFNSGVNVLQNKNAFGKTTFGVCARHAVRTKLQLHQGG